MSDHNPSCSQIRFDAVVASLLASLIKVDVDKPFNNNVLGLFLNRKSLLLVSGEYGVAELWFEYGHGRVTRFGDATIAAQRIVWSYFCRHVGE